MITVKFANSFFFFVSFREVLVINEMHPQSGGPRIGAAIGNPKTIASHAIPSDSFNHFTQDNFRVLKEVRQYSSAIANPRGLTADGSQRIFRIVGTDNNVKRAKERIVAWVEHWEENKSGDTDKHDDDQNDGDSKDDGRYATEEEDVKQVIYVPVCHFKNFIDNREALLQEIRQSCGVEISPRKTEKTQKPLLLRGVSTNVTTAAEQIQAKIRRLEQPPPVTLAVTIPVAHIYTIGDNQHNVNMQTARKLTGIESIVLTKHTTMTREYLITGRNAAVVERARLICLKQPWNTTNIASTSQQPPLQPPTQMFTQVVRVPIPQIHAYFITGCSAAAVEKARVECLKQPIVPSTTIIPLSYLRAFTVQDESLLNAIRTECGVTVVFGPASQSTEQGRPIELHGPVTQVCQAGARIREEVVRLQAAEQQRLFLLAEAERLEREDTAVRQKAARVLSAATASSRPSGSGVATRSRLAPGLIAPKAPATTSKSKSRVQASPAGLTAGKVRTKVFFRRFS